MKRTLTVVGKPRPQGSMRALPLKGGGAVAVANSPGIYQYRGDIQSAFYRKYGESIAPLEGPITLHAVFIYRRPNNHFRPASKQKNRKARTELMPNAPGDHFLSTPDVDKLLRAVSDSLTGVAYVDDKQVSDIWGSKRWGDADMTIIDILQPGDDEEDAKNGLV